MTFDAQCDVAAIAYGPGDDPDRLLTGFAEDLRRAGLHPIGVIQTGHDCRSAHGDLGVVIVPDGQVISLLSDHRPDANGCRLDAGRFDELTRQLGAAMAAGADLVIINRFGHLEAEGHGLAAVIAKALDADIPVLIAVPAKRFADWIRFCNGMNVRLACDREAVDRWWQSVGTTKTAALPVNANTFCEIAK